MNLSKVKSSPKLRRPAAPAETGLLKQQAYASLKDRIISGDYQAGAFLSERMLVADLGMSKTPIRSALELLDAEGFVSVSPRQGIIVRQPTFREIADQFELRLALEGYVLRKLAGQLSKSQVDEIRGSVKDQQRAASAGNLAESIRLDREFHLMFCRQLGNSEILRVMTRLREKMMWIMRLVFQQDAARMTPNWKEHRAIADAVIDGEGGQAVELLAQHLEYGKRALLR
jgi:DNA-binding GntR family transcriptional regulator